MRTKKVWSLISKRSAASIMFGCTGETAENLLTNTNKEDTFIVFCLFVFLRSNFWKQNRFRQLRGKRAFWLKNLEMPSTCEIKRWLIYTLRTYKMRKWKNSWCGIRTEMKCCGKRQGKTVTLEQEQKKGKRLQHVQEHPGDKLGQCSACHQTCP